MVKLDVEKTIHGLSCVIRDQCFWLGMGRCCPAVGSPCMGIERRWNEGWRVSSDDRSPWQPTAPPHHPVHPPWLQSEFASGTASWQNGLRGRTTEVPWISVDKCGGTETGFETRERTVTPANLCLMIIAYPRSVEIPMEFSLPRSLKISKPRRIGEFPSRWLMAEKSTWKIQIIRKSALYIINNYNYYHVCVTKLFSLQKKKRL